MTNEQKYLLAAMRKEGRSYNYIADALGISKNTVKSYCQRHKEEAPIKPVVPDRQSLCRACGKELPEVSGRKPLKFCSSNCRVTWWNSHLDLVNRKATYTFVCACCGKPFTAYGNNHRKYCCHACYIQHRFKGGDSA